MTADVWVLYVRAWDPMPGGLFMRGTMAMARLARRFMAASRWAWYDTRLTWWSVKVSRVKVFRCWPWAQFRPDGA